MIKDDIEYNRTIDYRDVEITYLFIRFYKYKIK